MPFWRSRSVSLAILGSTEEGEAVVSTPRGTNCQSCLAVPMLPFATGEPFASIRSAGVDLSLKCQVAPPTRSRPTMIAIFLAFMV